MASLVPSPALDRFVDKIEIGECWRWTGGTNGIGYGRFLPDGRRGGERKVVYAHRFAYEAFVGSIPEGLELDHLCRNTLCVRPDHLEPVTRSENLRRGYAARDEHPDHCPHGHRWDEVGPTGLPNLAVSAGRRPYRYCRRCNRERGS